MKKFEKPFVKIVVLEEVLVCSTSTLSVPKVKGQSAEKGTDVGIWDQK